MDLYFQAVQTNTKEVKALYFSTKKAIRILRIISPFLCHFFLIYSNM